MTRLYSILGRIKRHLSMNGAEPEAPLQVPGLRERYRYLARREGIYYSDY